MWMKFKRWFDNMLPKLWGALLMMSITIGLFALLVVVTKWLLTALNLI
jgi:hypothetical protein